MGTNSTIAVELVNGTIKQIMCHWDGYIEHNGRLLNDHWNDYNKVVELMKLGELSRLGREIGSRHDFSNPHDGWCLAYGRDRGESLTSARTFENFDQYVHQAQFCDYNYVFLNGRWSVATFDMKFRDLARMLDIIAVESLK